MRRLFFTLALLCLGFSPARAYDPNKPWIYSMRFMMDTWGYLEMYSTATVVSKPSNFAAFRVVTSTTNPVYQLLVTTEGCVGISTGNPQAKFHVSGGESRFGDDSAITISSSGYMTFANLSSTPAASAGRVYYDSGSNKLRLSTGSAWADLVTSADNSTSAFSGAVSVGTTTSSAVLTVYSGGADALNVSVITSSGTSWSSAALAANWSARTCHSSVVFNNRMWVMGGETTSTSDTNEVWYSSDGTNWTQATATPGWSPRHGHTSVVFNDKIWIVGGTLLNGTFYNDVWYSSDGTNWTRTTSGASWGLRAYHTSVVFQNKIWTLGGWNAYGGGNNNEVWYSSDGANWTQATASPGWSPRRHPASVVFNDKIWLIGGYNDTTGLMNDVWYSADGINWAQATASAGWPGVYHQNALVFNNKMWHTSGVSYRNDVWYSSDGSNWTQTTAAGGWTPRWFQTSLVFNNRMWVIGGSDSTLYKNDVWYSNLSTGTASSALTVTSAGNVGIGTTIAGYNLTVNGTAWVTGGAWSGSDTRWKKNVAPLSGSLDKILKLRGVSFDWRAEEFPAMKFPSGGQIGFVAQEVKKVVPEIVSQDGGGYLGISYEKLVPVMAEAMKEQQREIEGLKSALKAASEKLEAADSARQEDVNALKARLSALEIHR